uniref:LAETG motif-containing sortase-dependent surface protein n=1 Tax=Streptomyces ardesiacus TaxID=285564 RepID=UPI002FDBB327
TASGSPLHEVVADQDVIVTPGATTRLTITDPFKVAKVLLQAKDDKTGKLLPGATVNIGTGTSTLLTLTTGAKGTASGELPMSSRKAQFWVKEIKAPVGYDLYKTTKTFTAGPGDPVTVTFTNARTATTPPSTEKPTGNPTEKPTAKPTARPSGKPSPSQHGEGLDVPAPSALGTQAADEAASSTTAPVPAGSLAHTGADATPWLIGGAAALIATGGGVLVIARRRRTDNSTDDGTTQS